MMPDSKIPHPGDIYQFKDKYDLTGLRSYNVKIIGKYPAFKYADNYYCATVLNTNTDIIININNFEYLIIETRNSKIDEILGEISHPIFIGQ